MRTSLSVGCLCADPSDGVALPEPWQHAHHQSLLPPPSDGAPRGVDRDPQLLAALLPLGRRRSLPRDDGARRAQDGRDRDQLVPQRPEEHAVHHRARGAERLPHHDRKDAQARDRGSHSQGGRRARRRLRQERDGDLGLRHHDRRRHEGARASRDVLQPRSRAVGALPRWLDGGQGG